MITKPRVKIAGFWAHSGSRVRPPSNCRSVTQRPRTPPRSSRRRRSNTRPSTTAFQGGQAPTRESTRRPWGWILCGSLPEGLGFRTRGGMVRHRADPARIYVLDANSARGGRDGQSQWSSHQQALRPCPPLERGRTVQLASYRNVSISASEGGRDAPPEARPHRHGPRRVFGRPLLPLGYRGGAAGPEQHARRPAWVSLPLASRRRRARWSLISISCSMATRPTWPSPR